MKRGIVLRVVGLANGRQCSTGYVASYDVDATPCITLTDDITQAFVFADVKAAHRAWTLVSTRYPLRDDGKPNRPLTAFTVQIEGESA